MAEDLKIRSYRFLLYPDNKDMMRVFKTIQRNQDYNCFVGAWHTVGKKHLHLVLHFKNPRHYSALLKSLDIDSRWCRPIGYSEKDGLWKRVKWDTLENAYCYLPHINTPEKEQYSLDSLFGTPTHVIAARQACIAYKGKKISRSDCIKAIRNWVVKHYGEVITPAMFINWIIETPYIKEMSNSWVRSLIDSHNQAIYASIKKVTDEDLEYAREIYERRKSAVLDAEYSVLSEIGDLKEYKPLY